MPFPPDPPWLNRREFQILWDMHLARHDRGRASAAREQDLFRADYERDRAEHTAAHAVDRAVHAREHAMTQLALDKAATADDQRFASVNEFRQTLTDQAVTFARAETVDAHLQALATRLDVTERNQNERRDTLTKQLGDRITALEKYADATTGQAHGASMTIAYVFGAIGFLSGVAGLLSRFIQ